MLHYRLAILNEEMEPASMLNEQGVRKNGQDVVSNSRVVRGPRYFCTLPKFSVFFGDFKFGV